MKGLKAALRSRDEQLLVVERKLRQLRDVANHDTQEVAEQFGKLKSEGQTHRSRCDRSSSGCASLWVLMQVSSILLNAAWASATFATADFAGQCAHASSWHMTKAKTAAVWCTSPFKATWHGLPIFTVPALTSPERAND